MIARLRHPVVSTCLGVLLAPSLLACGAAPAAPPPPGIRVRVATVADWNDLDAFARRVARASGTAVRDASGVSSRSFAITLICPDQAACERAITQLAGAADFIREAVPERGVAGPRPVAPSDPKSR